MLQFTDDCLTGVEQIDKEHRAFFELARQISQKFKEEEHIEDFAETMDNVVNLVKEHNAHEEEYMRSIDDPNIEFHMKEHRAYEAKLDELKSIEEPSKEHMQELVDTLVRWFYKHIISVDTLIGSSYVTVIKDAADETVIIIPAFTDDFKTYVDEIDEQHKTLFDLVDKIYSAALSSTDDKYDLVLEFVSELLDYAENHFASEEEYMESVNYPELPAQKKAHGAFLDKLAELGLYDLKSLDEEQDEFLVETLHFLLEWLVNHIKNMDTKIGKWKDGAWVDESDTKEASSISNSADKEDESEEDEFDVDAIVIPEFGPEFKTGIEHIDEEHRTLFELVERIYSTATNEFMGDKYEEILVLVGELLNYAEKHFADEEEYMESVNYPGLDAQKKAHGAFLDKLTELGLYDLKSLDEEQDEFLLDVLKFLLDWLISHIKLMDVQIGEW